MQVLPIRTIGIDLYPEANGIIRHDFLTWQPPTGKSVVIGNPPFGKSSRLAIDFFNRAATFADIICFIVPVTWEKYSVHCKLPDGWGLIASERMPEESFTLGNEPISVRCSMQIWGRGVDGMRYLTRPDGVNPFFEFVAREQADFAIRQAYPNYFKLEDATGNQSYYFIKAKVPDVERVFAGIDWQAGENRDLIGGASVPCLDRESVLKFYIRYTDQRQDTPVTAYHPDFDFVSSSDDWDFCMSSSPCIVRSKDYYNQRGGRFCSIFIRAKVPDLFETFNRISWQSVEGKAILGGSRFPVADQPSIVKIYSLFIAGQFPAKRGDWRRYKQAALVRKWHGVDSPEPIIIPYQICQNVPDPRLLYAA